MALKFSNLQKAMANKSGFEHFNTSLFTDRQYSWAQNIDEEVINELFSLLYLVHNNPKSQAFVDWLQKHIDVQNCPQWSFLGFAWKAFFHPPLGRYVTGVMTANWKKSVSNLHHQTDVKSHAAQFIIDQLIACQSIC
jgi:hypothetical protein